MTIFQVIATLFALFMMFVVRIHGQKKTLGPMELSFWYTIWVVFIVISVFPDLLIGIVGVLHFARVFDLLLVMALMVLTVVIFMSYFAQKAAIKKLERFVNLEAVLALEERLGRFKAKTEQQAEALASGRVEFLIVTPSYNQARFLDQTIKSVRDQDVPKLKYWVMDGGSTDGSAKLLKKWQQKWKSFKFVSKKDNGQTEAINQGIKKLGGSARFSARELSRRLSRGKNNLKIFAYINSDDYYLPGAFAKVAAAFATHPEKMWLVGECQIVDEKGKQIQGFVQQYKKWLRRIHQPWMLQIGNPYPQPAVFIRWEAVQKVGLFDAKLRYTMDYEYWQRLQKTFGLPLMVGDQLAAFRIHGQSKGGSQYPQQFAEELQVSRHYTSQPALLLLHSLHNGLITTIYNWIK